jgi:hypothetical protein
MTIPAQPPARQKSKNQRADSFEKSPIPAARCAAETRPAQHHPECRESRRNPELFGNPIQPPARS